MAEPAMPTVGCTYKGCARLFDTKQDMIDHKRAQVDHPYYCKICRMDCIDWEDSLNHKVHEMLISLELRRDYKDPQNKRVFKHIVCEFCGLDFKSLGGRDLHKKREHQADQQIECQGSGPAWDDGLKKMTFQRCKGNFARASQYIHHIEGGYCKFLKHSQIETERQQKHIVKEILKDPERFAANLQGHKTLAGESRRQGLLYQSSNLDDDEDSEPGGGGVLLIDTDDTISQTGIRCLEPEMDTAEIDMVNSMEKLSTNSPSGPSPVTTDKNLVRGGVWAASNTTSTLFPDAKPNTSVERDWQAIQASRDRTRIEDDNSNLMYSRFWDPSHHDYKTDLFRTGTLGQYECPFPDCIAEFLIASDMTSHLRTFHLQVAKRCTACSRSFKSLTGLLQHFESSASGRRCRIANSDMYEKVLHEATGGFLSVTKLASEAICGSGKDDGKASTAGVRDHEYKSQLPASRPGQKLI
ncbi:hypothetical protein AAFC00_006250 [Neodothiora populina]|uniref:C2H2-type domain-containing protein n=1 Tax=Neodothiora populina TaxID=2781224 RepID=A0ABR3P4K0_9PEZI